MKHKTALVCIAKNEDNYLKEWVDYHNKLGFSDIFVFQNNWRYNKRDFPQNVHLMELDGKMQQNTCYNSFILKNENYDWVAFFDVDEFLYIEGKTLDEFLDYVDNADVVYVHWRLFGDSGLKCVENENYSVINRFRMCERKLHRLGKCLIHLSKTGKSVMMYNPHIAICYQQKSSLPKYSDTYGHEYEINPWDDDSRKFEQVELYHFRNKTFQENVDRKYMKDDAFHDSSKCDFHMDMNAVIREFENHNKNEIRNDKLFNFMNGVTNGK